MPKRKTIEQLQLLTRLERAKHSQYTASRFEIPKAVLDTFFFNGNSQLTINGSMTGYWHTKFMIEYTIAHRTFDQLVMAEQLFMSLLEVRGKTDLTILWKD